MKKIKLVGSAAVGVMVASGSAYGIGGHIVEIDLTGWETWGRLGAANNSSIEIDLSAMFGADYLITGVGWDLTIASIGDSWNGDVTFDIDGEVLVRPADPPSATGTNSYSSGGIIKLVNANLPAIVISDGDFRIEAFESFDDPNNTDTGQVQDANLSGSLLIQVGDYPAPSALALLAVAGIVGVGGRRRRDT